MSHSQSEESAGASSPLEPEAVERVMAAAVDLFSNQQTEMVTVKWIGMKSGVPSAEIADRWTPRELMDRALADLAERIDAKSWSDPSERADLLQAYERIVVRALLSGLDPADLGIPHPELPERLRQVAGDQAVPDRAARRRASQLCALSWGWRLFGPYLAATGGLGEGWEDDVDGELEELSRVLSSLSVAP